MQINKLHVEGKVTDAIHALAQGPDHRARVFNRCFINGYLFRTAQIEKNLSTQNSGVVVKGDASAGGIDWYGVVKKIYALDFPMQKEVVLFECDWYDVPPASKSKAQGFKRDQYGIIDIDASRKLYLNDPFILGTQAEQVFYVKASKKADVKGSKKTNDKGVSSKKPDWWTVIRMKPRNVFSMPEDNDGEIDVDSLDVGVKDMKDSQPLDELTHWTRPDVEGVIVDESVIKKAHAESKPEPTTMELVDDEEDDTTRQLC
jgi:hypothetical protein